MKILVIICGGIAAYKSLDVIRAFKKDGHRVQCVMTQSAQHFITPLSVSALSEEKAYTDLFSLTDESEMGHIRLARECDAVLVMPATANMIAKSACGLADDLAGTILLATDKPVFFIPAMNPQMWKHPAVQNNLQILQKNGTEIMPPETGLMACGETGEGRFPETEAILQWFYNQINPHKPLDLLHNLLTGKHFLVTAGATQEPIDPVRFISNHSSGKQGYAIAESLAKAGAKVTLVSGKTHLPTPKNVDYIEITTAKQMLAACLNALPCDGAICVAAVADWSPVYHAQKLKKDQCENGVPVLQFVENPDILQMIATHPHRPVLVIGFAAETENLLENAQKKLHKKQCDWIIANHVCTEDNVFGSDENEAVIVKRSGESVALHKQSKQHIADKIVQEIVAGFVAKR